MRYGAGQRHPARTFRVPHSTSAHWKDKKKRTEIAASFGFASLLATTHWGISWCTRLSSPTGVERHQPLKEAKPDWNNQNASKQELLTNDITPAPTS